MGDSPFDQILAFGAGRALFGGSTASERELDRMQRERQHKEMLAAIQNATQSSASRNFHGVEPEQNLVEGKVYRNDAGAWLYCKNGVAVIGLTHAAQKKFDAIVFVELPTIGRIVTAGEPCAVVESIITTSDLYAPISGKVVAVNNAVTENPGIVNTAPEGDGWLFQVQYANSLPSKVKSAAAAVKSAQMEVVCPHCSGGILFSVRELGGKVADCPHCSQPVELPRA